MDKPYQFVFLCHVGADVGPLDVQISCVRRGWGVGASEADGLPQRLLDGLWPRRRYLQRLCRTNIHFRATSVALAVVFFFGFSKIHKCTCFLLNDILALGLSRLRVEEESQSGTNWPLKSAEDLRL